jgi:hypothetical protein
MSVYRELRFWSVMLGSHAVRLSMVDARGGEFYRIVSVESPGKAYREMRDLALTAIEGAIARGEEPGEVADEERVEAVED